MVVFRLVWSQVERLEEERLALRKQLVAKRHTSLAPAERGGERERERGRGGERVRERERGGEREREGGREETDDGWISKDEYESLVNQLRAQV